MIYIDKTRLISCTNLIFNTKQKHLCVSRPHRFRKSMAADMFFAYYSTNAYYMNPVLELPTGKGFVDVVYLPKPGINKPALLVELKWNKSAQRAIRQIKETNMSSGSNDIQEKFF